MNLKREYERLIDNRKIQIESAKFDSLNARLQIAQAEATLKRTRDNLEMIKKNLDNLYIRAPISGRLSTVNAEVGESISTGQNIGQIDDLNGFKVRASIDEHYIARIYDGLKGSFPFAGNDFDLEIRKVYPEVALTSSFIFSLGRKLINNLEGFLSNFLGALKIGID